MRKPNSPRKKLSPEELLEKKQQKQVEIELSVFDTSNASSLINVVPERLVPILHRLKPRLASVLYSTENDLKKYLRPDERDERVRLGFWDEYNVSTRMNKRMALTGIYQGIISFDTWTGVYEQIDNKMLWVLSPPVSYSSAMRSLLHKGTERLMEIMSLPILDENGKPDSKTINNILKAFQLVDLRVKGGIAQKVDIRQQSLNLHQAISPSGTNDMLNGRQLDTLQLEDLETLERRIDKARRDSRRLEAQMLDGEKPDLRGGDYDSPMPRFRLEDMDNELGAIDIDSQAK